ncbi:hypothetical protein [Streptomyces kronopolitis]
MVAFALHRLGELLGELTDHQQARLDAAAVAPDPHLSAGRPRGRAG